MAGAEVNPCDPNNINAEPSDLEAPPNPEAPAFPAAPMDCRSWGCDIGECEPVGTEELCESYPPFEQCLCDGEELVCEIVSPAPYCWEEEVYECVELPPPVGACDTPDPSESCLTIGCEEGFVCEPSSAEVCVPSSCSCDDMTGEWACTEDCGQPFVCVSP